MKSYIFIVLTMLLCGVAFGSFTDGLHAYYSFDQGTVIEEESALNRNLTFYNGATNTSVIAKLGQSLQLDGVNDYADAFQILMNQKPITISVWLYSNSTSNLVPVDSSSGSGTGGYLIQMFPANQYTAGMPAIQIVQGGGYTTQTWQHIVYINNATGQYLYQNATLIDSDTGGNPEPYYNNTMLGCSTGGANCFSGFMDEFGVWNKSLSLTQIQTLFANGSGYNPFSGSSTTYAQIKAYEFGTSNPINTFNATFSEAINVTTMVSQSFPFNLSTPTYANWTFLSEGQFTPLCIQTYYGFTINGSSFDSVFTLNKTNSSILPVGSYALSGASLDCGITRSVTLDLEQNATQTRFNTTNGTIVLPFSSTDNRSYTTSIEADDYFSSIYSYNFTLSGQTLNAYLVSRVNVSISFYDEDTFLPLQNVSYTISSSVPNATARNGTITSGTLSLNDLLGTYEIRYNATNYTSRSYFITIPLQNANEVNLTLFDLRQDRASTVLVKVTDKLGQFVDGLKVSLLRRYIIGNTTQYYIVEQARPIQQLGGQTVFSVVPNVIPYIFRVEDAQGNILYQGSGASADNYESTYIINSQLYIKIDAGEDVLSDFARIGDTTVAVTNTSNTFYLTYSNLQTSHESICLVVTENNRDVLSTQCSTADGAVLSYTVPDANNTYYVARAQLFSTNLGNTTVGLGIIDNTLTTAQAFGYLGLLLLLLTMVVFSVALASNPVAMILMQVFALLAFGTWFLNITALGLVVQGTVFIMGLIVAYIIGGRN